MLPGDVGTCSHVATPSAAKNVQSGLGIQLTCTIYTHIPPVASVGIEATLPRGGVQFLCRKPLRQPSKSRPRGHRNKMVFLQPVSTFEITWEDFMCGKVSQVQKRIPNYFSSPVFATSGCTTRCCLSQWVIYLGKKKNSSRRCNSLKHVLKSCIHFPIFTWLPEHSNWKQLPGQVLAATLTSLASQSIEGLAARTGRTGSHSTFWANTGFRSCLSLQGLAPLKALW